MLTFVFSSSIRFPHKLAVFWKKRKAKYSTKVVNLDFGSLIFLSWFIKRYWFLNRQFELRNISCNYFFSQPVAWFGGVENGYRGVHFWPEPDPVDSKLTLLKVSFKQRQHEVDIWGQISVKCYSIRKRNCGPKDLLSSQFYFLQFSLSKSSMHNELLGSAEILASFLKPSFS